MISIHVTMTFIPEFTLKAKALVKELAEKSSGEIGCSSYQVWEDVNDENTIIIEESFFTLIDLNFHRETNHYKEILKDKLPEMIKEKVVRFVNNLQ